VCPTHQVHPHGFERVGVGVVLQGGGAVVREDHVARLVVEVRDPRGKLGGVGEGRGEEDLGEGRCEV
jgi:hypothetical protein